VVECDAENGKGIRGRGDQDILCSYHAYLDQAWPNFTFELQRQIDIELLEIMRE